jgi:broad specificity phosphatase PhoE
MNIHITPRTIYLTRHGESMNNTVGKIGGDPDLSSKGSQYAAKLSEFINNQNIPGNVITCGWFRNNPTVQG